MSEERNKFNDALTQQGIQSKIGPKLPNQLTDKTLSNKELTKVHKQIEHDTYGKVLMFVFNLKNWKEKYLGHLI